MYGNNPNVRAQPFAPRAPHRARSMQGGTNPYGFGLERAAGRVALQTNVPGRSTNVNIMPVVEPLQEQAMRQRFRRVPWGY